MSDRSKFIRLNATETALLKRVLERACAGAGTNSDEAAALRGVLDRLRKVWLQPPRSRRAKAAGNTINHEASP